MQTGKRTNWTRAFLARAFRGSAALAALLIGVAAASPAEAWWDGKWSQRKMIRFDTSAKGADIKENLTDVPVLIRLHTGNFSFSAAKEDGADLRFIDSDDKTPLKFHIEKFDPQEEIALVWVKVPRISGDSGQDSVWMYYGNASAPDGQDMGGTYDVNQVAVYHLRETQGGPKDATAYGNHAPSFTGKPNPSSLIGNGARFGGGGEKMTIVSSPSLNFNKGFTFSTWLRLGQPTQDAHLFSWDDGKQSIVVGIDVDKVYCSVKDGKGQGAATPKTAAVTPSRWQHLAVTIHPNNRITLFLDGNEVSSAKLSGPVPEPAADILIGASAKGGNSFAGELDEIELSNTARYVQWMKAAFQGQGPDGKLTSVLEGESGGGGEESLTIHLLRVIIRTITLDGWLIIGVLFVMGALSFFVFMQKLGIIRASRKDNTRFAEAFRTAGAPMALVGSEAEFPGSPLCRVYGAGAEEWRLWTSRRRDQGKCGGGIAASVMNAFRTALEKAAMQESRKLTTGMFILNMSVAGGPFLGLLGTVWGVMNTFASLAEAGEANLTAIAPGVASALACTLAGLLVAIPALFVSIYITGRFKDLNADMNVFIEEFILRMEDEQGGQA